ncbi:helix-turn-helix domain-containing protein [Kribbella sp. NPDC051952]|uniref:PucR family transcriptional regulator n=1 Tax=Kribbella sp. NPDC051952 TaxID=3154851 RepID=UPI00343EEDB7
MDDTLQDRLDRLALATGHSLSIDAPDGRLIAYSAQNHSTDPVRVSAILARHVAPEVQAWQNQHGIADATGPVEVLANPELGMAARLCVPVRQERRCVGYLWVLSSGRPLEDSAVAEVVRFAGDIAPELGRRRSASLPVQLSALIRGVLGESASTVDFDDLAAAVPSLLGARIQICVVVSSTPDRTGVSALTSTEFVRLTAGLPSALGRRPEYVGSYVGASQAVVLVRCRSAGDVLSQIFAAASAEMPSHAVAGISEPVLFELDAVRTAYNQALAAAELAALDPALPNPLTWSDLGPYRRLLRIPASVDTTLAALDNLGASAPMLLRTLETYLDLAGDAQRTAARLHLHRTSLYYRLRRIADLLDVDLDNGLTRLDLHLTLKSRRLSNRTLS